MLERLLQPGVKTGVESQDPWTSFINAVETLYGDNRAPEMEGTPKVSDEFFNLMREGGVLAAWSYLVKKEEDLGDPNADERLKAGANLLASSTLVFLGISKLKDSEIGQEIYTRLTLPLLFYAQEDEKGSDNDNDNDNDDSELSEGEVKGIIGRALEAVTGGDPTRMGRLGHRVGEMAKRDDPDDDGIIGWD